MGRWPQLVGPEVAQHCEPQRYDEDARVLTVQLRLHGVGDAAAAAGADSWWPGSTPTSVTARCS